MAIDKSVTPIKVLSIFVLAYAGAPLIANCHCEPQTANRERPTATGELPTRLRREAATADKPPTEA
jgi:hypothetical protein